MILNAALVAFFVAIGIAKSRGLNIQCGCFGAADSDANYAELFIRDGFLLGTGLVLMWLNRSQQGPKTP